MTSWMKKYREFWAAALVVVFAATYANATSIYSWSSGEVLTSAQLNSNFAHIHNSMVGGHGARLVDSDVSASAAISSSKLAARYLIPTAWAKVGAGVTACSAGTCTLDDSGGSPSVAFVSTGVYTITLQAQSDTTYAVVLSSQTTDVVCVSVINSTTSVTVTCRDVETPAVTDAVFSFIVFDT
jgi:hypothetical protein